MRRATDHRLRLSPISNSKSSFTSIIRLSQGISFGVWFVGCACLTLKFAVCRGWQALLGSACMLAAPSGYCNAESQCSSTLLKLTSGIGLPTFA